MKGDFRTGKRLNMRKIIPFIASGFRKDKIWMRRVQPDQRTYPILLAVDNSSSMRDNTGELALEAVCLVTQALSLLGIGEFCVASFGEETKIVHPFGEQWNDDAGALMMDEFQFMDERTEANDLLEAAISHLEASKKSGSMQLCFIVGDGHFSNKDRVRELVNQAQLMGILIVYIIIDSQTRERQSVLKTRAFTGGTGMKVVQYLDVFPFPYYVVIRKPEALPEKLADALRQWFDLANAN
jgi:midasin